MSKKVKKTKRGLKLVRTYYETVTYTCPVRGEVTSTVTVNVYEGIEARPDDVIRIKASY